MSDKNVKREGELLSCLQVNYVKERERTSKSKSKVQKKLKVKKKQSFSICQFSKLCLPNRRRFWIAFMVARKCMEVIPHRWKPWLKQERVCIVVIRELLSGVK